MSFLLDTCVLSETVKKTPNSPVVQWINHHRLVVVTRNVDDFKVAPVEIVNPYLS